MALITREAIKNPEFLTINITRSYRLAPTKRSPEGGYVANHHKMFNKNESVYYPGAFAGKTGYTSLAGNTLVTCAKKDGMTLIAVVLNGHQSHYCLLYTSFIQAADQLHRILQLKPPVRMFRQKLMITLHQLPCF